MRGTCHITWQFYHVRLYPLTTTWAAHFRLPSCPRRPHPQAHNPKIRRITYTSAHTMKNSSVPSSQSVRTSRSFFQDSIKTGKQRQEITPLHSLINVALTGVHASNMEKHQRPQAHQADTPDPDPLPAGHVSDSPGFLSASMRSSKASASTAANGVFNTGSMFPKAPPNTPVNNSVPCQTSVL